MGGFWTLTATFGVELLLTKGCLQATVTTNPFGLEYLRPIPSSIMYLSVVFCSCRQVPTMLHQASAAHRSVGPSSLGLAGFPTQWYVRIPFSDYLCPLVPDDSSRPAIFSGALGPTIQSSIASHSLQLFSAASISAMMGAWSGRMNGTDSNGSIS